MTSCLIFNKNDKLNWKEILKPEAILVWNKNRKTYLYSKSLECVSCCRRDKVCSSTFRLSHQKTSWSLNYIPQRLRFDTYSNHWLFRLRQRMLLQRLERTELVITIIVLFLVALFIFRPMVVKIRDDRGFWNRMENYIESMRKWVLHTGCIRNARRYLKMMGKVNSILFYFFLQAHRNNLSRLSIFLNAAKSKPQEARRTVILFCHVQLFQVAGSISRGRS